MFSGTLVYLHGFKSGPQSQKAQLIKQTLTQHPEFGGRLLIPNLGFDARAPLGALEADLASAAQPFLFIGSSLGGYYATYLAERSPIVRACAAPAKVILINPSVKPFELLPDYLGWVNNLYTGESFEVTPEYFELLKNYQVDNISHPERYLLLTKSKDEVLDYWQAVEYFKGAHMIIDAGGDHAFDDLSKHLPALCSFLGLNWR